jgi:hypothetical protein
MFPFVCEARNLYSRDETRLCNVEASLVGPDYLIPIINSGAQRKSTVPRLYAWFRIFEIESGVRVIEAIIRHMGGS